MTFHRAITPAELFGDDATEVRLEMQRRGEPRSLSEGEILFEQRNRASHFVLVDSGQLQLLRVDGQGNETFRAHPVHAGELYAVSTALFGFAHPARAVARQPSTVILVEGQWLRQYMLGRPDSALCLVSFMTRRIDEMVAFHEDEQLSELPDRIVSTAYLAQVLHPDSELNQTELATHLGVARETLNRQLNNGCNNYFDRGTLRLNQAGQARARAMLARMLPERFGG